MSYHVKSLKSNNIDEPDIKSHIYSRKNVKTSHGHHKFSNINTSEFLNNLKRKSRNFNNVNENDNDFGMNN